MARSVGAVLARIGILVLCGTSAWAGPPDDFRLQKGPTTWTLTYRVDLDGVPGPERLTVALDGAAIRADRQRPVEPSLKGLSGAKVRAVRRAGPWGPGVTLQVEALGAGGISIAGRGPRGAVRRAQREALAVAEAAGERWLEGHGLHRLRDGSLMTDHVGEATAAVASLRPLADALSRDGDDPRTFADRLLRFVQAIPYEKRLFKGGDPGFRPPLAMLSRHRGDCDSKAALFLAVMRAKWPTVPLAMVVVPGHALVGVGVDRGRGERTLRDGGVRYVLAEPVGPALAPMGEIGPSSRRGLSKRTVTTMPVGP